MSIETGMSPYGVAYTGERKRTRSIVLAAMRIDASSGYIDEMVECRIDKIDRLVRKHLQGCGEIMMTYDFAGDALI